MQASSNKGRNKATDLKKLMQLACKTQRIQTIETQATLSARQDPLNSDRSRINKTLGTNNFAAQLKELNMKKGLTSVSIKNKQNQCTNKKKNSNLTSSIASLHTQTSLSTKQLKLVPVIASIDFSKLASININTTTNKNSNYSRFENQGIKVPPATSREKSPPASSRRTQKLKITDFNLGRKLGKGRFGSVRIAQHRATKFILAIKTINIEQLKQSDMENQLVQEVKLQMFCDHPNILKMYGCFSDNKNIYLLLELGSICLFHELRSEKHYSEQKTAYYIIQVIESLKYIHSQSIIHRDIKPQNILLTEGVIKLSDFGWSTYSPLLKRQTFCGTLDYVSPQIVNGEYYDEKVDIWSLGILCYQLAVGKAPFQDPNNNQEATYDNILAGSLSFPKAMSVELKDLISKILLKNPQERMSMSQIQAHPWLQKHKTTGRYISKEVWDLWEGLKSKE